MLTTRKEDSERVDTKCFNQDDFELDEARDQYLTP